MAIGMGSDRARFTSMTALLPAVFDGGAMACARTGSRADNSAAEPAAPAIRPRRPRIGRIISVMAGSLGKSLKRATRAAALEAAMGLAGGADGKPCRRASRAEPEGQFVGLAQHLLGQRQISALGG